MTSAKGFDASEVEAPTLTTMPPDYSRLPQCYEANQDIVALRELARWPRVVDCPACHTIAATRILHKVGTGTHISALVMFLCTGVGAPLPYFAKTCKDVEHYCTGCRCKLVTTHSASGTEIHKF